MEAGLVLREAGIGGRVCEEHVVRYVAWPDSYRLVLAEIAVKVDLTYLPAAASGREGESHEVESDVEGKEDKERKERRNEMIVQSPKEGAIRDGSRRS